MKRYATNPFELRGYLTFVPKESASEVMNEVKREAFLTRLKLVFVLTLTILSGWGFFYLASLLIK